MDRGIVARLSEKVPRFRPQRDGQPLGSAIDHELGEVALTAHLIPRCYIRPFSANGVHNLLVLLQFVHSARARVTVVDQSGCAPQLKNESQAYQTHNHAQLEDGARKNREPETLSPKP